MLRKFLGLTMATLLIGTLLVLGTSAPASAQKVGNPGPVTFTFESGNLKVGNSTFAAGEGDDAITITGNVQANGNIVINPADLVIPDQTIAGPLGNINVHIAVVGTPTGNINPFTGATSFSFTVDVQLSGGGLPGGCHIGPITIVPTTANVPNGVPYNTTTGFVTVADTTFSVPGAQNCGFFNGTVNDQAGVPSPSGNNHAILTASTSPIIQPGVIPSFTATPASGPAPLLVNFDASATFAPAGVASYQWDFDGNGSFDSTVGPMTSFNYVTPGTYTVKLRVTDTGGDAAETTRQVVVEVPHPDLTIDKSHDGSFVTGVPGSFALDVSNGGSLPATGTVTVTDTLPAGLVYAGTFTGTGWSCDGSVAPVVVCTSDDDIAIGASAAPLAIDVVADGSVIGDVVNTATVAVFDDNNAANDSDSDTATIIQAGIDLAVDKTHDLDDGIFLGEQVTYRINVSNAGTLPAVGTVVVTDTLPVGFDFNSVSGGGTWVCFHEAGVITCFTNDDVPAGTSLPSPITIIGDVDVDVDPEVLSNTASVAVDGDANLANNSDTDTGDVLTRITDLAVTKTHVGDFIVGEPASYAIVVANVGNHASGGDVVVRDTLPAGMAFDGAAGDGWTCVLDPDDSGVVECTHDGGVEAGDQLPTITLKVTVSAAAIPSEGDAVNVVDLTSNNDGNDENDHAEDPTVVRMPEPDLTISKTHVGNFVDGSNGTYTLVVSNLTEERADGPTVVTDVLPAGLTFVSASGTGWSCANVGQFVGCQYDGVIAGQSSAPAITLVVLAGSPAVVTNTATVSNGLDDNPVNDTASDPTRINVRPQAVTTLDAQGIIVRIDNFGVRLLAGAEARLTANFVPVPGKVVTFSSVAGAPLCSAVTNADGVAACTPWIPNLLTAIVNLRYVARFAGDVDFTAATDEGALIRIGYVLRLL